MPRKLLFEDVLTMADKWAVGTSGRNAGPQPMSLLDMLKKSDNQHPNYVKAPGAMPHSVQNLVQLMGDLYVQSAEIKKSLLLAKANPVLDGKTKAKARIQKIVKKIGMIQKIINSMSIDIDGFSIEAETDGSYVNEKDPLANPDK